MVHEFRWRGADVLRLLEEARNAPERIMTFSEKLEVYGFADRDPSEWSAVESLPDRGPQVAPALHFVSDEGVYLMSNAVPTHGTKRDVVYAVGYHPRRGTSHIGGDDFVERLGEEMLAHLHPLGTLVIRLDPHADTFSIGFVPPPRTK